MPARRFFGNDSEQMADLVDVLKYAIVIPDKIYAFDQAVSNKDVNGYQIYPADYRLLTYEEMLQLQNVSNYSWEASDKYGVFQIANEYGLKTPGMRLNAAGTAVGYRGVYGYYWTSTISDTVNKKGFIKGFGATLNGIFSNGYDTGGAILAIPKYKPTSLIPSGYHVPSQTEWQSLIDATNSTWNATNTERIFTNKTGSAEVCRLNAQGYVNQRDEVALRGTYGYFWTSSIINQDQSYVLSFSSSTPNISNNFKILNFSVRLIPDNATDIIDGMSRSIEFMQQYSFNEIIV